MGAGRSWAVACRCSGSWGAGRPCPWPTQLLPSAACCGLAELESCWHDVHAMRLLTMTAGRLWQRGASGCRGPAASWALCGHPNNRNQAEQRGRARRRGELITPLAPAFCRCPHTVLEERWQLVGMMHHAAHAETAETTRPYPTCPPPCPHPACPPPCPPGQQHNPVLPQTTVRHLRQCHAMELCGRLFKVSFESGAGLPGLRCWMGVKVHLPCCPSDACPASVSWGHLPATADHTPFLPASRYALQLPGQALHKL